MTQQIPSDPPIPYDPMWNHLRFAVYRLNYRVTTPMLLPAYKGSVFRGALLQQLTRISEEVSAKVFQTSQASWSREATGEPPSPFLAHLKEVPPPYVLEPPLTSQRFFEPGEMLAAHLILELQARGRDVSSLIAQAQVERSDTPHRGTERRPHTLASKDDKVISIAEARRKTQAVSS